VTSPHTRRLNQLRKAVGALNPEAPSVAKNKQSLSTPALSPRLQGSPDPVPEHARMLMGMHGYLHQRRVLPDVHERDLLGPS
jgi:hypothetical protein